MIAEAGDGEEAQALIEKHKPDVAVLDIQMAHIFAKIQANSRTEAVMRAVSLGWIAQDTGALTNE